MNGDFIDRLRGLNRRARLSQALRAFCNCFVSQIRRLILPACLLASVSGYAATYVFEPTTFALETAANVVVWDNTQTDFPDDDDKAVVAFTGGFTFTFGGVTYNQVRILTNGALQFGADTAFHRQFTNVNLANNTAPPACGGCAAGAQADRIMSVYWDDINPNLGGAVRFEQKGTAPNRRFVVSWENVPHFSLAGSYNFQIILHENGDFVYQYGAGNADGASATIGVEVSNTDYTLFSFNNAFGTNGTAIRWFIPGATSPASAELRMDEASWSGAANEVVDSSGNGRHGVRVGAAQTAAPGRVCRAGNIPSDTSTGTISAVNTDLDVDSRIGNSGSISFWYKSNLVWNGGGALNHQLFDATTVNNRFFFLVKRTNGGLRFVVSDGAGTNAVAQSGANAVAANTWKHIAVTWRLSPGANQTVMRIYLDGVLRVTTTATTNGSLHASLGTLFLGDNRSGVTGQNGTGNSANGMIDEVRIYNFEISNAQVTADMNATRACGVNHIRLLHDAQALTCAPETITVQACGDANCTFLFTDSVTTTLQPPGWIGGDTITFTGGSTTAELRRTTTGTVTLGATTPDPTTGARCFNGGAETCSLEFFDAGFLFNVPDLTACQTSASVTIAAVRTDDVTKTCAPAFTGAKTVNFWSTYSNPATGTQAVSINGTNIATASPGTGVSLIFDAAAQSTFTVRYPDAGQMQLNARFTGAGAEAGLVMNGSDTFVSTPVGLAVFSTDPAAACPAGDASCSVFTSAGTSFPLQVKAACWTADGDTDLSDNPATPNFRLNNIGLGHSLIAPGGGQLGSVGAASFDMVAADNGVSTVNQSVSEVGVFRFTATPAPAGYFGLSVPGGTSVNMGRFTPHHFALASGTLTNRSDIVACGDTFTYMNEPFRLDYTLRAENASNGLTQNYTGSFAMLNLTSAAAMGYGAVSGTTNLTARLAAMGAAAGAWSNGSGTVAAPFTISRAANPDGPFAALGVGIAPTDGDGVQFLAAAMNLDVDNNATNERVRIGNTEARFGRLRVLNAYGSELLDLPVQMTPQYWNGGGFLNMGATDSCTIFAASDIALSFPVAPTNRLAACETRVSLTGGLPANLLLTKPGSGNDGWTNLRVNLGPVASGNTCTGAVATLATTANKPYLRGNWGTVTFDQDPTALVRFGVYRSGDGFIYFRENY